VANASVDFAARIAGTREVNPIHCETVKLTRADALAKSTHGTFDKWPAIHMM